MTREISYKVFVLRNGCYLTELHWEAGNAPRVDMKADAELKCSFQGTFFPNELFEPLTDELQAVMVSDGQEQSLGIFRVTTSTTKGQGALCTMQLEGYDRGWMVQNTTVETPLYFKAGTKYLDAVRQLLTASGIGLLLETDSPAVLPADREDWDLGTDYLSIVNELLSEIGYKDLWFDADGYAHIEPYVPPSSSAIKRQYSARDIRRLPVLPDFEEETDIFDAPNVFVCVCSNADRSAPMTATSVNDSPISSKSTCRRGRRIVQTVKVHQIADQEALQAYADKLKFDSMQTSKVLSFAVPAESGHGLEDVIGIDHEVFGGIYVETGWSLRMAAGTSMAVTARRTVIQ